MNKEIYDKYGSLSGFLEKKQNMFLSQKRFFKILNGKSILYSEKDGSETKGVIEIENITKIEPLKGEK